MVKKDNSILLKIWVSDVYSSNSNAYNNDKMLEYRILYNNVFKSFDASAENQRIENEFIKTKVHVEIIHQKLYKEFAFCLSHD